ncbi:glycosyltransferase [Brevibacterium casei]|uniref:glycosyltransferase n=1 Tax=Brevibacterium casei TaxID=33889 RepID=UPI0027E434EC|nr:glycosyltransferase [Brevibacterium casei]
MRISVLSLHTSPAAQPGQGDAGGMNVYVDHTVRALAASGHEVDVFTADPHGLGVAGDEQARSITLAPNLRLHRLDVDADSKDALAGRLDDLARLLTAHPVFTVADLVWAHYWISAEAALRSVRTRGGPRPTIIASMHTIGAVKNRDSDTAEESPRRLRTEERIAAGVDLLVANTPAERRDLIGELGADPASVVVARPGVDHALFSPGSRRAARAELGLAADENLVLYVGRMQFIKGTDVVVDALACLHENNPELSARTRGVLLGAASGWVEPSARPGTRSAGRAGADGRGRTAPDREWNTPSDFHATLSAAIAAEPNVEVRPPVPAAELVTYYRAADVLLVPSRSESFGLVAAEAAASGLPSIASAVGGLPEIVENGYSGLLIADHNPRYWALTLERLLGDAELRAELADHAAARSQRFDWNRTVAAVLDAVAGEREDSARIRSGIGAASRGMAGDRGTRDASDLTAPGVCGGWR